MSLLLVDPRYYHLDTALAVLAPGEIAYLPEAFAPTSRKVLERLYPDAIRVSAQDASVLGLNAVSDGANVAVAAAARGFAAELTARGFRPHPVDMSELAKAGGGAKCCTLELHEVPGRSADRTGNLAGIWCVEEDMTISSRAHAARRGRLSPRERWVRECCSDCLRRLRDEAGRPPAGAGAPPNVRTLGRADPMGTDLSSAGSR